MSVGIRGDGSAVLAGFDAGARNGANGMDSAHDEGADFAHELVDFGCGRLCIPENDMDGRAVEGEGRKEGLDCEDAASDLVVRRPFAEHPMQPEGEFFGMRGDVAQEDFLSERGRIGEFVYDKAA